MIEQILFIAVIGFVIYLASGRYGRILKIIKWGKKDPRSQEEKSKRWRNVALVAFGQKKMFKRPIPAVLHLFIYLAFLLTQIDLIEIIIDGVFGTHRFTSRYLGPVYTGMIGTIEVLSALALVATLIFIFRRVILKIRRFQQSEMDGWPSQDALFILFGEILLVCGIFIMNGADVVLQSVNPEHYTATGYLPISSQLGPYLFSGLEEGSLVTAERLGWWLHILVVFGFILYLPISKHLHIFLAFFNTYYAKLGLHGHLDNMPTIADEVKSMLDPSAAGEVDYSAEIPEFGAKDVPDLYRRQILAAYTCTECGRCTDNCPANLTGKALSPRKIVMNVRDRCEEIEFYLSTHRDQSIDKFDDGKNLFDMISDEEIFACTTCNACAEACPVLINPLDIIEELRRYKILTLSQGPADWTAMFTSVENSGSVWPMHTERDAWTKTDK